MEGVTCDKKAQSESVKNLLAVDLFIEGAAIHVHQKNLRKLRVTALGEPEVDGFLL